MARGKCGKIIIRDELSAKIILARLVWKDKGQFRAYECNLCWGHVWHVTSQEPDPGRNEKKTGSSAPQSIDEESSLAIGYCSTT
jgi:hypothetical protein